MDSLGTPEVEFKEIVPCLKFETQLKHGCFHLKLYSVFQDWASAQFEPVFSG